MLVRVYADAAFRYADGASAAGGVIIRDGVTVDVSEVLAEPCDSPHFAEIAAIGAVIRHAVQCGLLNSGDDLVVLGDSRTALKHLARKGPARRVAIGSELDPAGGLNKYGMPKKRLVYRSQPKQPELAMRAREVRRMIRAAGARLKAVRWVKGHNLKAGTEDAAANHRCDCLARAALRESRKVAA